MQIINKKCPHCGAIFKIKSALESHLQTKHPDKKPINIDQIPDVKPLLNEFVNEYCISSKTTIPDHHLNEKLYQTVHINELSSLHESIKDKKLFMEFSTAPEMNLEHFNNLSFKPRDFDTKNIFEYPSKSPLKVNFSDSEISFSDSNNEMDESEDFFIRRKIDDVYTNESFNTDFGNSQSNRQQYFKIENVDSNTGKHNLRRNVILARDDCIGMVNIVCCDLDNASMCSPASSSQSQQTNNKKRFRTQMSNIQVNILRVLFQELKTPSMTDCENIGREIGLPKRVVQVGQKKK